MSTLVPSYMKRFKPKSSVNIPADSWSCYRPTVPPVQSVTILPCVLRCSPLLESNGKAPLQRKSSFLPPASSSSSSSACACAASSRYTHLEQRFCFNSKNAEQLPLGLGFPNFDCSVDCIFFKCRLLRVRAPLAPLNPRTRTLTMP